MGRSNRSSRCGRVGRSIRSSRSSRAGEVVVRLASLVVSIIQFFLMLTQTHKDKKSPLGSLTINLHSTGDFSKSMVKDRVTASGSLFFTIK